MQTLLEFLVLGLHISAPIAFASLGGIFSERSGVVNIGLEGIMIVTTFFMAWGGLIFGSPIAGLVAALISGGMMASIHAVATITFRVDQIVSGVAINILALGISRFLSQQIFGQETQTPVNSAVFPSFLGANTISFLLIPIAIVVWYVLFHTSFGLRLRAVGENRSRRIPSASTSSSCVTPESSSPVSWSDSRRPPSIRISGSAA